MRIFLFTFFITIINISLQKNIFATPNSQLKFVENKNQWDDEVKYKSDLQGGHIYFASDYFQYVYYSTQDLEKIHDLKHEQSSDPYKEKVNCYAYNVKFLYANSQSNILPNQKMDYYENYFIGNDAKKWAGNVRVFENIIYKDIYKNIDVKAYSVGTSFKYDLIVNPNGDVNNIKLQYNGIKPQLLQNGNLKMDVGFNTIEETAPFCYQIIGNKKVEIKSKYVLTNDNILSFDFPNGYNKNYALIIDPTLVFATYSASTGMTFGFSATYDLNGSLYAGGECFAVGWAVTPGAFQIAYAGGVDAGINKYNPLGTGVMYATYFGGSGSDLPSNMVVNNNNELAITGSTSSPNLPTTAGCYNNTLNGVSDAYVVHFNAAGNGLIGATYIGGSGADAQNINVLSPNYGDASRGEIYFDTNDDIVLAMSTQSNDFPTTPGAYQTAFGGGSQDACFFKLNSSCSNLIFSTYLGGTLEDAAFSIAKNSVGNWVLCGGTRSANFPTTAGSYTPIAPGATDGFVTIFNNNASAIVSSTFIGTSTYDHAFKVQVDDNDTVYACGQTDGATFPVSPGVYSNAGASIFFVKLLPDLSSMVLSTRIGQTQNLVPTAFLKDNCGNVYFSGFNAQNGLPLTPNAFQANLGGFWLCVLSGDFSTLVYATYMGVPGDHVDGGTSRFDPQGIVYQSVCTSSLNQYQSPGCYAPLKLAGGWDVASFKFNFELSGVTANYSIGPADSGCAPLLVNFSNQSYNGVTYKWFFGDGDSSDLASPSHTYLTGGTFIAKLIAYNANTCIPTDTAFTTIKVIDSVNASFLTNIVLDCIDDTVHLEVTDTTQNAFFNWSFGNGGNSNGKSVTTYYINQGVYTITCFGSNGFCFDTTQQVVNLLHPLLADFGGVLDTICLDGTFINPISTSVPLNNVIHTWDFGDGTIVSPGLVSQTHVYTSSGNFIIKLLITDTLGCQDSISKNIFVDVPGYANFTVSDTNICVGDPIFFNDTVSPHTISFDWDMDDGTIVNNIHNPQHSWHKGGSYDVTLTARFLKCLPVSKTKKIIVNEFPSISLGKDTSICPGVTGSIFLADINNPGATYHWSTGETGNGITVSQVGHYWVKASNGECTSTDSIWVKRDCYLNIPNAFSPDGDGLNDYFLPRELLSSGLRSFKMEIFNRWGENIFSTTSIDGRGWDGKYNGVKQPMGVYVFVIEAEYNNNFKKTYKGNVTLIR